MTPELKKKLEEVKEEVHKVLEDNDCWLYGDYIVLADDETELEIDF